MGIRPVIEMMFMSFSMWLRSAIQQCLCRYMSGGLTNVLIVVRGPANGGTNVAPRTPRQKIWWLTTQASKGLSECL